MNRRVSIGVLERAPYHGAEVAAGFRNLGFEVTRTPVDRPGRHDIYVNWNRYARSEPVAEAYERAGGTVLVMENGYLGRDRRGGPWFALSVGQHNGLGLLPPASLKMWDRINYPVHEWRDNPGGEIVILATRGIGSDRVREPEGWAVNVATRFRERLPRERMVRIRSHPGRQGVSPDGDLESDIAKAEFCVTWGSTAGLKALLMGVPVFHGLKGWIGSQASYMLGTHLPPYRGSRDVLKARLATAMWSLDEIRSGEAFRCVLRF